MRIGNIGRLSLVAGLLSSLAVVAGPALGQDSDLMVNSAVAPSTLDPAWACGLQEISFIQNF